jgi:hypothetical protein
MVAHVVSPFKLTYLLFRMNRVMIPLAGPVLGLILGAVNGKAIFSYTGRSVTSSPRVYKHSVDI